jgi:hypothetical protein
MGKGKNLVHESMGGKTLYVNKHFLHRAQNLKPQQQALKVK